jgi:Fe-S-cluster containining protein
MGVRRSQDREDELRAIYAAADTLLEGWGCDRSTDCCHFARTGREPQLWPNEWALLERALRARPAPKRRGLPMIDEGRCPLLGDDGKCVAYAARPFGCRTFFCDRATGPTRRPPRSELAELGRKIAALAEKGSREARPRALTSWLSLLPSRERNERRSYAKDL